MSSSTILTPEQKETLNKQAEKFNSWLNTEKGRNTVTEHREHEKYFKHRLSSENLAKMTENEFSECYKKLWASNMWRAKDWYTFCPLSISQKTATSVWMNTIRPA